MVKDLMSLSAEESEMHAKAAGTVQSLLPPYLYELYKQWWRQEGTLSDVPLLIQVLLNQQQIINTQLTMVNTLGQMVTILNSIVEKENAMAATLDDVQTAVAAETTVEGSVITLLNGIAAQLAAALAANDPAKVQAIVDQITANTTAMSAAVAANTPAAPTT